MKKGDKESSRDAQRQKEGDEEDERYEGWKQRNCKALYLVVYLLW